MNLDEVYEALIIKTNENSTTDKISLDRGRAAVLLNEASIRFVEWTLQKRSDDDIRYLRPLLISKNLINKKKEDNSILFKLPNDYFDIASATCEANKDTCCNIEIELFEVKSENLSILEHNEFYKPSFEYREAPFILSSEYIKVITQQKFDISKVNLTYYKYPKRIELENIEDPDSNFKNNNEQMELDDRALFRIINIAKSLNSQNVNPEELQLDKIQVNSKF